MSAAKHTPGPWAVGGTYRHQYVRITADSHNKLVGTVRDCEMDGLDNHGMHRWVQTEEGRANARLIVAAPEYHDAAFWIRQAVAANAAPVNPLAALEELALDGEHVTLDAGLVLDLLKAHAKATGSSA